MCTTNWNKRSRTYIVRNGTEAVGPMISAAIIPGAGPAIVAGVVCSMVVSVACSTIVSICQSVRQSGKMSKIT